ncbi:MAG TPA: mechanosensitive ion channel domain-containing protein, partial [Coleofasciculaceae cyanobacterium]
TKYSLISIGTLIVLQIWGLDISSLTILVSALGVGIGFGLQDIAKNFGSGLVLILERPIQVGDFVEIGSFKGTVERIGGRSTEIRTLDHVSIIVPNSRFLSEEVINWSHHNPVSRLHLPVGVAYHSDPQIVRTVLLEAAQSHTDVLQSPLPQVFFTGFGDSALNFDLLVWTTQPSRQFILKSDLYFRIFELLQERQIEVPFPQRDLHLRSGILSLSPQTEALLTQQSKYPLNGDSSSLRSNDPLI